MLQTEKNGDQMHTLLIFERERVGLFSLIFVKDMETTLGLCYIILQVKGFIITYFPAYSYIAPPRLKTIQ